MTAILVEEYNLAECRVEAYTDDSTRQRSWLVKHYRNGHRLRVVPEYTPAGDYAVRNVHDALLHASLNLGAALAWAARRAASE